MRRSTGSLGTWMFDSPVRYWTADGDLLRTTSDDPMSRLDSWREDTGAWVEIPSLMASSLDALDAVPISPADAEAMFPGALA